MVYDSGACRRVIERVVALGESAGFPTPRAEARGAASVARSGSAIAWARRAEDLAPAPPRSFGTAGRRGGRSSSAAIRTARVARPALHSSISESLGIPIDVSAGDQRYPTARVGRRTACALAACITYLRASSCSTPPRYHGRRGSRSPATCWKPRRPNLEFAAGPLPREGNRPLRSDLRDRCTGITTTTGCPGRITQATSPPRATTQ